jgi:NADPH:quinone reductase-like Zn-dependent oxidoreductase
VLRKAVGPRLPSVSFAEVLMLRGQYFTQPRFPFVPGYDLVSTVSEVGDCARDVR